MLVPIIRSMFNFVSTLSDSVTFVLVEDYQLWELIIVDDNSSGRLGMIQEKIFLNAWRWQTGNPQGY